MIESSGAQVAPRGPPSVCATVTVGPPVIAILVRIGDAIALPAQKPSHCPSGETKTERSPLPVAIARGSKPMTFLYRPDAKPFGFTNPIWIQ